MTRKCIQAIAILVALAVAGLSAPASAKCAVRSAMQADGKTAGFTVVVPDAKVAEVGALGYQEASCAAIDKAKFREQVCAPEKIGNSGMRRQLEIASRVSFEDLCTLARAEAGLPEPASAKATNPDRPGLQINSRRPLQPGESPNTVGPLAKQAKPGLEGQ